MADPDPRCGERGREGVCRPRSLRFHPKGNHSALPQLHCASRENTVQLRPLSTPIAYPALGPRDPQRVPAPPPRARAWSAIGASRPRSPPPSPPSLSRWRRSQRRRPRRLEPEQEAEAAAAARGGGVPSDWDGRPGRAGVPRRAEHRWGWAKRVRSAAAFSPSCPATAEWTPHRSTSSTRFSSGSQRWGECGGGGADSGGMWSCHCPERWQPWARERGRLGSEMWRGWPRPPLGGFSEPGCPSLAGSAPGGAVVLREAPAPLRRQLGVSSVFVRDFLFRAGLGLLLGDGGGGGERGGPGTGILTSSLRKTEVASRNPTCSTF